jgi:hypothetical protein
MAEFTFNFIAFSRTIKIALSHNIAIFTSGKLFYARAFPPLLLAFSFVTHRNNHKTASPHALEKEK